MRQLVAFANIATSKKVAVDFKMLVDGYLSNIENDNDTDDRRSCGSRRRHDERHEARRLLDWLKADAEADVAGRPSRGCSPTHHLP